MTVMTFSILVVFLLVHQTHAHSTGAGTGACGSFTPSHTGTSGQTVDSYFAVLMSKTTYTAGETISVTLEARCGDQFKGFLLQARRADPNDNNDELIGTFTPIAGTKALCNNGDATLRGLTHDNAGLKTSITVQWTAPNPATGHIIFKSTFVRSFNTYWVALTSGVLTDPTAPALSVSESSITSPVVSTCPASTTAATAGGLSRNAQCGVSRGCFDDCSTGCTFTVSWATEGNNIRFWLQSLSSGNSWIGVGFSSDKNMGVDSVSECVVFGGVVRAFQSYNVGYSNSRLTNPEEGISDVSGSVVNGVFSCSFLRVTEGTADSQSFNLSLDWFLLAAHGSANAGFSKSKHSALPSSTASVVDLQSFSVSGATTADTPLVKAHGSLMMLAWVLLAPLGMILARFFKPMWPDKTIGGTKIWFQLHRLCMVVTLFCTIIAFILIFVEADGYSTGFVQGHHTAHPILGIIVTVLVIINPLMALVRPNPKSDNRWIFDWAHYLVGRLAEILAIITTFFGLTMSKARLPEYVLYILGAYCVWQIIVEITLEVVKWTLAPESESTRVSDVNIQEPSPEPESNYSTINIVIVGIHILVVVALTFTLIGLLAAA